MRDQFEKWFRENFPKTQARVLLGDVDLTTSKELAFVAWEASRWNIECPPKEFYTCVGKGGRYEILGLATGAGLTRGEDRLVYRDASTGRLFLRTEQDFSQRMERIQPC